MLSHPGVASNLTPISLFETGTKLIPRPVKFGLPINRSCHQLTLSLHEDLLIF